MIDVCRIKRTKIIKDRGDSQMKNRTNQRLQEITTGTLIVGVDVAKEEQWARMVDYRGVEIRKAMLFKNNRQGFESIVARILEICKLKTLSCPVGKIMIGMEPTGHYWKALANYLMKEGYRVVCVNPYHTKKAKELDDNSPTKSDKKDALTIARLVKDGRFFDPYLPQEEYGELRGLTNARVSVMKRQNAVKNTITAILDEYFPEIRAVFKHPLKGKASRQILKSCPFPVFILAMGEDNVLAEIKKTVKKTVGIKKVRELMAAAKDSIGVQYGLETAKMRLGWLLDELELAERQLCEVEQAMETELLKTGYAKQMLGIKGIGIVTAASFLGEVGDPLRFQNARQIARYAGYNLVEDSSGKSKSGTCISKRGRKQLRSVLYQMAFTMVGSNDEMKTLYRHLTTRKNNPLKKKQALVVVSKKIITVIYSLLKKQEAYQPERVLGTVRKEMLLAA
jgi:transposase